MFRRVAKARLLTEAGLQALCPSLNSPVLNLDELPVGAARAAIVVSAAEYGDLSVWVAVRMLEEGEMAIFSYNGPAGDLPTVPKALDAALSFAEGMGFLFDDDWVPSQGRAASLALWSEITAAPGEFAEELPPSIDSGIEPDELELDDLALSGGESLANVDDLLLDEVAALELDQPIDAAKVPPVDAAEGPPMDAAKGSPAADANADSGAARAAPTLTKFRGGKQASAKAERAPARDSANSSSALGRIALVRKRLGGGADIPEKRSLLVRLLGQF